MSEKTFENNVLKWLAEQGVYKAGTPKQDKPLEQVGWVFKHWGGGMSASGIPDLIACIRGQFIGIEVKAENGRPSVLQEINVRDINQSLGYATILYPKDFDKFKDIILTLLNQ